MISLDNFQSINAYKGYKNVMTFKNNPFSFLDNVQASKGDIIQMPFLPKSALFCFHPDHVRYVCVTNHKNYIKNTHVFKQTEAMAGKNGLFYLEGDFWARVRRATDHIFRPNNFEKYEEIINHHSDQLFNLIDLHVKSNTPISVFPLMLTLTCNIICEILTGYRSPQDNKILVDSFFKLNKICGDRAKAFLIPPSFLPTIENSTIKKARKAILNFIRELLNRHENPNRTTLVSILNKEFKDFQKDLPEFIQDQMLTFIFGGHETMAVSFSFLLQNLAHHLEYQDEILTELDIKPMQGTSQNSFISSFIKESLRLDPPAWIFARTALGDDQIDGVKIKAGSSVFISVRNVHRHLQFWDQPTKFYPERFHGDDRGKQHAFKFCPFGAGPKICSGTQLAYFELITVLRKLCAKYELLPVKTDKVASAASFTAYPAEPIEIKFVKRGGTKT